MIYSIQAEILIIAGLTATTCALMGVFLFLRGASLMSDALSHSMLPGIVLLFFVTQSLHSPLLLIGACVSGLLTVLMIEALIGTERIKKDAVIGICFPLFFSIGVILITLYAHDIHLDTDMVLLGELAFAPFNRLIIKEYDCGPIALWLALATLLCNIFFICMVYKELTVSIFDAEYALVTGFRPRLLYYIFMALVSFTIVVAFDSVGAIVVVSLMIVPVSTASLLVQRLSSLIFLTLIFALSATFYGYAFAHCLDLSLAGSLAVANGLLFAGVFGVKWLKSNK